MSVTVATCTAADLLAGNPITTEGEEIKAKLAIPEYQRPYTWQKAQINQLIDGVKAHQKHAPTIAYYLGSLILHRSGDNLFIIDGQQRITTLAIMAYINKQCDTDFLRYESPKSHQQIAKNLQWLEINKALWVELAIIQHIQFSLVITDSEDDAYSFFETQNTGGVRLSGPDIIKAHHLRAINDYDETLVDEYAKTWEQLKGLSPTIDLLLKGRYWQHLHPKRVPFQNQIQEMRESIIDEFGYETKEGKDTAFKITRYPTSFASTKISSPEETGYSLRQPLNSGINTIHYLKYFEKLKQDYLIQKHTSSPLKEFSIFYHELVNQLEYCHDLRPLFDTCLLFYISQFGEVDLEKAAKFFFRVVYSRRISSKQTVRANSIHPFVKEYPVFDWISQSFTPEQCFTVFDTFKLKIDPNGLDPNSTSRKNQFVKKVSEHLSFVLSEEHYVDDFKVAFNKFAKGED